MDNSYESRAIQFGKKTLYKDVNLKFTSGTSME